MSKQNNTHAHKAESYHIGRPDYPEAFFDYLYNEVSLPHDSIIADVGAGTGKNTKKFLEKSSKVFAVEPDKDMMKMLRSNLSQFPDCLFVGRTAEDTGIPAGSVDLIFCGNSYMWFDRSVVVPEFKRIIRADNHQNIVIARLGPGEDVYAGELIEIDKKFSKPVSGRPPNNSPPFQHDIFVNKVFDYTLYQDFNEFLHGCLSASSAPNTEDDIFEDYVTSLRQLFEKYSNEGKLETRFKLFVVVGCVDNLAQ
ncbi:MAG: class I SAM-dependent methyltransferase [Oscillospiraceae bacterium]|nr:class I SAM-dependent methyltransferase [Oscillospiraceae bacterium]